MLSDKERITSARRWRKRFGGGMRQIGILAAAGHYALDHNIDRLAEDHTKARQIATAIAAVTPEVTNPSHVETNIVVLDLSSLPISAAELNADLKTAGIAASALGPNFLRIVTHLGITDADVTKVNEVLPELLNRALKLQ